MMQSPPPPPPRGQCHGGFFKSLFFILFVVHFYNLHQFRKALKTISAPKKATTVVDQESLSVAPVSVPIIMADKQEYPVV